MPAKKKSTENFEAQLEHLEQIVEKLEAGELPLEAAFGEYEKGIGLVKACQEKLASVEQKVQMLTEENDLLSVVDLEDDDEEDDEL